jgi:hypothetical protein
MEQNLKWLGAENEQLLRAGFYGQKKYCSVPTKKWHNISIIIKN